MTDALKGLCERFPTEGEALTVAKQLQHQAETAVLFWHKAVQLLEARQLAEQLLKTAGGDAQRAVEALQQRQPPLTGEALDEALSVLLPFS